jgi:hypothetical protein
MMRLGERAVMNTRILYFIAAALAIAAACISYFNAGPGENVWLRVGLLAVMGIVMLVFGLRRTGA